MLTFERVLLALTAFVGLYLIRGPLPVSAPQYPVHPFRWGLFGYYEPEYVAAHWHYNAERAAAAQAAYAEKWKPGMPIGLCGTGFVDTTYEPGGGFDAPMLACSVAVTFLGFTSAWLSLRRPS